MIKRTLYFSNPAYLKTKDDQLVFESTDSKYCCDKNETSANKHYKSIAGNSIIK
jgi:hypothetical protein